MEKLLLISLKLILNPLNKLKRQEAIQVILIFKLYSKFNKNFTLFNNIKGTQNKYDFGDLSIDEESDNDQEAKKQIVEQEVVTETKKKKNKAQKKNSEEVDLDSLLEQFGVEVKVEEKKQKEKKPKAPKVEKPVEEEKEVDVAQNNTEKITEEKSKTKKKKPAPQTTHKSSHINDLKRELLERKENLKKKEKKKGL